MRRENYGVLVTFALSWALVGWTQGQPGTLYGTITDSAGGFLPGVTVTLTGGSRGNTRTTVTNERGGYRFVGLDSGTYELTAELAGFGIYRREGIEIHMARGLKIDVIMRLAGVEETVTVTGETPMIDTSSSSSSTTIRASTPRARSRSSKPSASTLPPVQRVEVIDWNPPPTRSFNTEAYDHITDNPFKSVVDHPLSTFSIDVDRARPSPDFKFASAVAAFGMMLRDSPYRGDADWEQVKKLARAGVGPDPNGYRREFVELVELAKEVSLLEAARR